MPKLSKVDIPNLFMLTGLGFVLFSPISILAFPVSVLVINPHSSAFVLTVVGVAITLISFIPYWLGMSLLGYSKSGRFTSRIGLFLATAAITGALRGVVFYEAGQTLDLQQPSDLPKRIIASTFTTIFWLSTANFIINLTRTFRTRYQSTLNHYLASQMHLAVRGVNQPGEELGLDDFQADLSKTLSQLTKDPEPETFRVLSERLLFHINDQLRPLSRRIWLRSLSEYPVINYKSLLIDSIKVLRYSTRSFIVIMAGLSILDNYFLRSLLESIWRTASYIIVTFIIQILFTKFRRYIPNYRFILLFLVLVSLLPIYFSEFFIGLLGYHQNYLAATLITPVPAAVIILLALLDMTQRDRAFLLDLLAKSGDSVFSHLAPGVDLNQRQLASYLHNSFQSELLALSGQMAAVAISGDKDETAAVLQRVSAVASRTLSEDLASLNERPLDRLDSVVSSWKSMLEIEIDIPQPFLEEHLNKVLFVQTVEELASNAFRHDKATLLTVTANLGEFGTQLTFQSNGKEPITRSKGMGDAWLNQISLSPYSIEKNEFGTLIRVEI